MQNTDKNSIESIQQYIKSAAHFSKKPAPAPEEDILIDVEVPGDSYYKQYGDDEQELQELFSKE